LLVPTRYLIEVGLDELQLFLYPSKLLIGQDLLSRRRLRVIVVHLPNLSRQVLYLLRVRHGRVFYLTHALRRRIQFALLFHLGVYLVEYVLSGRLLLLHTDLVTGLPDDLLRPVPIEDEVARHEDALDVLLKLLVKVVKLLVYRPRVLIDWGPRPVKQPVDALRLRLNRVGHEACDVDHLLDVAFLVVEYLPKLVEQVLSFLLVVRL
jgi:hypothetical protein